MLIDLRQGARFPDLALPDHAGNTRTLSELAAGDAVALQFYRGWWCPKEQAFFRSNGRAAERDGGRVHPFVSVSVDEPAVAAAFRAGLGARWTSLRSPARVAERLALQDGLDADNLPYAPTVVTLYPDVTIHRVYNGYWFWVRPSAEELRQHFRSISRSIRPGWDVPR